MKEIDSLKSLIQASVSPYHCIAKAAGRLAEAGFSRLELGTPWELSAGNSYFVPVYDSTLIAFAVGGIAPGLSPTLRIAPPPTDCPCLKLKPSPELSGHGYGKLNVEVYGGPILSTWLDRPLSVAGKVCLMSDDPFHPHVRFYCSPRPILTIPNLAIHMNRDVNKGVALNPQVDMLPLADVLTDQLNKDRFFLDFLADQLHTTPESILDYELCIFNPEEGCTLGLQGELFSCPRLDNLTSVEACLAGLISARQSAPQANSIQVIALYDNEEIGSRTKQGAASNLTERVLEKIYLSLGFGRSDFLDALFNGFLLSLDVAHAIHPNHPEKCDVKNQITMGDGVAIKLAASQSYATDASHASVIQALCQSNGIPYRKFSNRSDSRGGSTLGSISSAFLNMPTVDAGIPILAMHSSRELMHVNDQKALNELVKAYLGGSAPSPTNPV